MAYTYTYEQFQQEAENRGMLGQFSQADLELARRNPDAGMSILKYKEDYAKAGTVEARRLANAGAERIRSDYGSYTAGKSGSQFYLDPLHPSSFDSGTAPAYTSRYDNEIRDLYQQQKELGSYESTLPKPTYENRHDETIQNLLGQVTNRQPFAYDPAADPLMGAYQKSYAREGQRATAEALGQAAAASGGIPSSYAVTAATQAGDYYAAKMADKLPELQQLAYNQYLNEQSLNRGALDAARAEEQADYAKYLNELGQFNTDRSFDLSVWRDKRNDLADRLATAQGMEQADYAKYLNELGQFNTDRNFRYGQLLDEINHQSMGRQEARDNAQLAAGYGDMRPLNEMGIDTSRNPVDFEREYTLAQLAAKYGDYSGLGKLGVNVPGPAPTPVPPDDAPKAPGGGGLGEIDGNWLLQYFKTKKLTGDEWEEALLFPGVTEEWLKAWGFTKNDAKLAWQ